MHCSVSRTAPTGTTSQSATAVTRDEFLAPHERLPGSDASTRDVLICGGGLAGLSLARQLHLELPAVSVLVADRQSAVSPLAAFKVGESSIEASAFYFGQILGMQEHLQHAHLRKMGLRFFFPSESGNFADRPEFGPSDYDQKPAYQLDRGALENHLRAINCRDGLQTWCNTRVVDVSISGRGQHHVVRLIDEQTGAEQTLRCRWIVDATGGHRLLQRRLGLAAPTESQCSAVWFRVPGRIDVGDFVDGESAWQDRVNGRNRYYSTNHLMGPGRWVWLIPLSSGHTSVGLVTHEAVVPFREYNTYEKLLAWLGRHEPELHRALKDRTPSDFRQLRHYSHASTEVFSAQRWACVGDAGAFADPLFSPGMDHIGLGNTMVVDLIRRDVCAGELAPEVTEHYNDVYLASNAAATWITQPAYPYFGHANAMAAKLLWNTLTGWAVTAPQRFNRTYLDLTLSRALQARLAPMAALSRQMERLFRAWATRESRAASFRFIDYTRLPGVNELYARNVEAGKTQAQLLADQDANRHFFERLAQSLFRVAVADVDDGLQDRLHGTPWLNAWAVDLDPTTWDAGRLFEPTTPPADYSPMRAWLETAFSLRHPT